MSKHGGKIYGVCSSKHMLKPQCWQGRKNTRRGRRQRKRLVGVSSVAYWGCPCGKPVDAAGTDTAAGGGDLGFAFGCRCVCS